MILVAATAIGIVGTRNTDLEMRVLQMDRRNLVNSFVLASPLLMSGSLALLFARLLPPRPLLPEVFRQSGFTASWVTALFMGINTATMFLLNRNRLSSFDEVIKLFNFSYFWPIVSEAGGGVLVAWMTLALAGCWRAEPSWIDRTGRVLGFVYVTAFLANRISWLLWLP